MFDSSTTWPLIPLPEPLRNPDPAHWHPVPPTGLALAVEWLAFLAGLGLIGLAVGLVWPQAQRTWPPTNQAGLLLVAVLGMLVWAGMHRAPIPEAGVVGTSAAAMLVAFAVARTHLAEEPAPDPWVEVLREGRR